MLPKGVTRHIPIDRGTSGCCPTKTQPNHLPQNNSKAIPLYCRNKNSGAYKKKANPLKAGSPLLYIEK
jgi:hypothetical protein